MVVPLQRVVLRRICETQSSLKLCEGKPEAIGRTPLLGSFGLGSVPAGRNVRFGTNLPIVSFESKGRFTLRNVSKLLAQAVKTA